MLRTLLVFSLFLFFSSGFAQEVQRIHLCFNKTVHVFFPSEIVYNDVGSPDVLIGLNGSILKLAASLENFQETNLTVITRDNVCYSFILDYKADITSLNYYIEPSTGRKISQGDTLSAVTSFQSDSAMAFKKPPARAKKQSLDSLCQKAILKPFSYWDEGMYSKKVYLGLNNIFVCGDRLFFVVSAGNSSFVDYDIDYFKLLVTDKKRARVSSIQDIEKLPVYSYNKPETVPGKTRQHTFVLVFEKFTIPQSRKMVFEMGETNGGRTISFSIKKDLIIKSFEIL